MPLLPTCQLATPADWTADKLVSSFVMSPDKKSTAVAHGQRAGQTFDQVKSLAQQMMPPVKVLEDSGKRIWYEYKNSGPAAGTNWYVAMPGSPVCTAQVTFKDAAAEDTAKKIALSVTQAK